MNKEETLALWRQGKDAWNTWAKEMLDRRTEMERDGTWATSWHPPGTEMAQNNATNAWMEQASASFASYEFAHEIDFSQIIFPAFATFEGAHFLDRAVFSKSVFNSFANFHQTVFHDDALFDGTRFILFAGFYEACFERFVSFDGGEFCEEAGFIGATFQYTATFINAVFASAQFNRTTFYGDACFSCSTCNREAGLSGAIFHKYAWFDRSSFNGEVSLSNTVFKNGVSFGNSTFSQTVNISEALFEDNAKFSGTIFNNDAWFNRTYFANSVEFDSVFFSGNVYFTFSEFKQQVTFAQAWFKAYARFTQATFGGLADFSAVQSERAFTLEGASFSEVPDFIQAHFSEAPRLDHVSIPEVGGIARFLLPALPSIDAGVGMSARYRALKRLVIEAHDHTRELDYFANELKALRGHPDSPLPCLLNLLCKDKQGRRPPWWPGGLRGTARYWFGLGYEALSNFGRSMVLPLIWWVLATAGFTWIYLDQSISADRCAAGPGTPWSAAFGLSIRKALPFAGIASSEKLNQIYACLYGIHGQTAGLRELPERFTPVIPDAVDYLGMGQLVLSLLLLFLFLLAVRSHFRIR